MSGIKCDYLSKEKLSIANCNEDVPYFSVK